MGSHFLDMGCKCTMSPGACLLSSDVLWVYVGSGSGCMSVVDPFSVKATHMDECTACRD